MRIDTDKIDEVSEGSRNRSACSISTSPRLSDTGTVLAHTGTLMLRRLIGWITTEEDCFDRIQWSEPCR